MSAENLEVLRQKYVEARPTYERAAVAVGEAIRSESREARIPCVVTERAKDVGSLIKKAIRKSYADPWDEIRDKAGVRALTVYERDLGDLRDLITDRFAVKSIEDKRDLLPPNRLDYLGVHLEVEIDASVQLEPDPDILGLPCEVQLHTRSQNLWATVSHELLYKSATDVPVAVQRSVFRLMALLELFDAEITRGRSELMSQPGYEEAVIVSELERHFYGLAAVPWDRQLSAHVVSILKPLLSEENAAREAEAIVGFVQGNKEKLQTIFTNYLEDDRNPLTSQPESLLIFALLERDKFRLAEVWGERLPEYLLASLAEIWGTPID